ncbi:MAG: hypothetical protein AAGJ28_06630 [Pseudomonadota bacterium]
MARRRGLTEVMAALSVAVVLPAHGVAASLTSLDGQAMSSPMASGDQAIVRASGAEAFPFAGHSLQLANAVALIGLSADAAHVAVVSGSIGIGELTVGPGDVVIIPPYGAEPTAHGFDAARLRAALPATAATAATDFVAMLDLVAKDQELGIFLGRYASTAFNLQAPLSALEEERRRAAVGSAEVAAIRFSSNSDATRIEAEVVDAFLNAMASADTDAAAEFIDPAPFGGAIDALSADARRAYTRGLAQKANWRRLAGSAPRKIRDNLWQAGPSQRPVTLTLQPKSDFIFISQIAF